MRRLGTGITMLLGRSDVPSWTHGGRQVRIHFIKFTVFFTYFN